MVKTPRLIDTEVTRLVADLPADARHCSATVTANECVMDITGTAVTTPGQMTAFGAKDQAEPWITGRHDRSIMSRGDGVHDDPHRQYVNHDCKSKV